MRINFPLRPLGRPWLFEDLARHLCRVGAEMGHECLWTADPCDAHAWVVLRTVEVGTTPDPARTVGMIHDLYPDDYGPGGTREAVWSCGGLVLTHPEQKRIIFQEIGNVALLAPQICRPIGACREFFVVGGLTTEDEHGPISERYTQYRPPGDPFTVGWVGRPITYRGRDIKRLDRLVGAVRELGPPVRVLLVGSNLAETAELLRQAGAEVELHDRYPGRGPWETWAPALYARMDALLITSELEAGPMCLFEALAAGVPVVTTPCGWADLRSAPHHAWLSRIPRHLGLAVYEKPAGAADALAALRNRPRCNPRDWAPALDSWCREVIELAVEVAR